MTTTPAPELSIPRFTPSYPKVGFVYDRKLEIVGKVDRDSTMYFIALVDGSNEPSAEQVRAGVDSFDEPLFDGLYGAIELVANVKDKVMANNLLPETKYDIWVVAENDLQEFPVKINVTTNPTSQADDPDKIHYNVTRPKEDVVDTDGKGKYNISPIGFPLQDVSEVLDIPATRFTPKFVMTYDNYITVYDHIERNNNIVNLDGLENFCSDTDYISVTGNMASLRTKSPHGFQIGKYITVDAIPDTYNGTYIVTGTSDHFIEYEMIVPSISNYILAGNACYQSGEKDVIKLEAQNNIHENGIYTIRNISWQEVATICKANTTANIDLQVGGLIPINYNVDSIVGDGSQLTISTIELNGMKKGNEIEITGTTSFNGVYEIYDKVDEYTFRVLDSFVGVQMQ